MLTIVDPFAAEIARWLMAEITSRRKPTPAQLMYHAFLQGMHAGWVGYDHRRDCPYGTNDYRMWWMHGCIVGGHRREANLRIQELEAALDEARAG
jgi:ribosome modulation factor